MVAGASMPVAPLFVPGDRPERFAKAAASGADAVILDLEDAVAPDRRAVARAAVQAHGIVGLPVYVRINAAATAAFADDLAALRNASFDGIMLAKAERADDVQRIHEGLGRSASVIALVESAGAFADLRTLLSAAGVVGAAFGSLNLALDLACDPGWEALAYCRGQLVLACRLARLPGPIDGVSTAIHDAAAIEADARRAQALGFGGKLAIHPAQIAPIAAAFRPGAAAIDRARLILARSAQGGATSVDGMMVDRPVIERARRILAHAERP